MRRVSFASAGLTAAFALIALVLAFGMGPSVTAGHGGAAPAAVAPAPAPAVIHPSVGASQGSANPTITGAYVSNFSINHLPYFVLPTGGSYNITWTMTVTNFTLNGGPGGTLNPNFAEEINVTWLVSGCGPFTFPCLLMFQTGINPHWVTQLTATSANFYFPLTLTNLTGSTYLGFTLPQGQWQFGIYANYNDGAGNASSFELDKAAYMGITPPLAYIYQPGPSANLTAGHTVIAGNYSGYFVATANVTVINSNGTIVLTAPIYAPGPGVHAWATPWAALTPGAYTVEVLLTAVWHSLYTFSETVNVQAAVPLTYVNDTSPSLIPGLGNGGSAALLITLGAVVGIVVMALLGRGMWGGSKPSAAQPWSASSGGSSSDSGSMSGGMGGSGGMSGSGGMGGQNPPS